MVTELIVRKTPGMTRRLDLRGLKSVVRVMELILRIRLIFLVVMDMFLKVGNFFE